MHNIFDRRDASQQPDLGQTVITPLSCLTHEYWHASQVLRGRAIDRPCDRATALRFLTNLAHCCNYDRLRCAAAGALASLGLTGVEHLADDTTPAA